MHHLNGDQITNVWLIYQLEQQIHDTTRIMNAMKLKKDNDRINNELHVNM